jgi:hypothetical protein
MARKRLHARYAGERGMAAAFWLRKVERRSLRRRARFPYFRARRRVRRQAANARVQANARHLASPAGHPALRRCGMAIPRAEASPEASVGRGEAFRGTTAALPGKETAAANEARSRR